MNGEIGDPVGALVAAAAGASTATPVPTLSEWALVLLSLLAAGGGALVLRRRAAGHG